MGKNITIKRFQNARLDEWIGDYKSADFIYEEIQKSDDKLSYLLEKTIKTRKNNLSVVKQINYFSEVMESVYIKQIDSGTSPLYQLESLQPRKKYKTNTQYDLPRWKYSVSVISKVDNDLRLEIRGYNPEGSLLKLNTKLPKEILKWSIENSNIQFSGEEVILFEINVYNEEENTRMYLTIDQWGLLCGTIIVDEECLGDILVSINMLLSELSNMLW